MADTNIYRRPAFLNRPWITGKLYDDYARSTIMHMDAFVFVFGAQRYLMIDWREGGKTQVALDGYLIEDDGLTPVWDIEKLRAGGRPEYWTRANHATMSRVHRRVLMEPARMMALGMGKWVRVVTQVHYVYVRETDCEIAANKYVDRKPYAARITAKGPLPDIL